MLINDKFHLTYCTNIHPGRDWESTVQSLRKYVPAIKRQVSDNQDFGIGLRLSNMASEELNQRENLKRFKEWLNEQGLYVFTMNGFPYGNFHGERVKDKVHTPDWTTEERVLYTKRLFEQLAYLIPEGISGGISTSPISYKHWHATTTKQQQVFEKGAEHLTEIIIHLHDLEHKTGKHLHLDIEPEPDGLLENSDEVIQFYDTYLLPIAKHRLKHRIGADEALAKELVLRYITICYDICHFSLAYEEPGDTFIKFEEAGIRVGKIQVSAALKIIFNKKNKNSVWESLSRFNEPTYLHQVTEKVGDKVRTYNDLPAVFKDKKDFSELRAHFHVPIFLEKFEELYSTQDHILKVISYLKNKMVSEHLEIETYTWDVLPALLKRELSESIIREINWLKEKL